jgi:putative hemolysin
MGRSAIEILIIFILTLINGFFAASEIAIIAVRQTRLNELTKQGNKKAKIIKTLKNNPEEFIATVQIGISVITTVASVFAGASLSEELSPSFASSSIPFIAQNASTISFILIVALISYMSLVLGELVPKSLALRYSERFAFFAAYPILILSRICHFLIKFLTFSSNIILKPFKDSTSFSESKLSEEEIRSMILEGRKAGTIERKEHEILENVFEFSDMTVGNIMTPSGQITAFNIEDPVETNVTRVIESEYSRLPFYKHKFDNIIGILNIKDLFAELGTGKSAKDINLHDLLHPAFYVPNTQKISSLLQKFQKNKIHMAIVANEHGEVDGLVTLEDILEEIVGDISDETDEIRKEIVKQQDGTFLVEGGTSIVDFNRYFKANLPEDDNYTTISGFILDKLQRFPEVDDSVEFENLEFKVTEKANRIVKFIQVTKQTAKERIATEEEN